MTAIDQLEKDTNNLSSFIILNNGALIAKITIKYGVTTKAYMTLDCSRYYVAKVSGGGYDKQTASIAKVAETVLTNTESNKIIGYNKNHLLLLNSLIEAFNKGLNINTALKNNFTIIEAF